MSEPSIYLPYYIPSSPLIRAGVPPGGPFTVVPMLVAWAWRSYDQRHGAGASRRKRTRARKRRREPYLFEHLSHTFVPRHVVLRRTGGDAA